ncbi:Cupredoxin [Rhizophagus diaphanus]|nr:Cupredoxin [Rhizophagus diaphanus] [Rhizophagus sp. MUCL 43196]
MMSLQQRNSKKLIALILACLLIGSTFAAAETVVIEVGGGGPENLKFTPQEVTANKGDTILWNFKGGNHNVVESSGKRSCEMKEDPAAFQSLTNPPTGNYTLEITNEKDIITYMCSVGSHCSAGMWGIIYVGGTEPPTFVKPTPSNKANKDNNNNASENAMNNTGKVAGIVIGSIFGFAIISAIGFLLVKRYRSKQRTVPTAEGIKRVVDNTDQATKDTHKAKLENV